MFFQPGQSNLLVQQYGNLLLQGIMGMLPGSGDVMAAMDSQQEGAAMVEAARQGNLLGAVGHGGMSLLSGAGALPLLPNLAGVIKAYHGSPHRFDRFSMENIGSGEGAQAYGHGLYFAENPGVAKSYQEQLSGTGSLTRGNTAQKGSVAQRLSNAFGGDGTVWDRGDRNIEDVAKRMANDVSSGPAGETVYKFDDGSQFISFGDFWDVTDARSIDEGAFYDVKLDVDHEDLLDWDKSVSTQGPKIQAAVDIIGKDMPNVDLSEVKTGAELYKTLSRKFGDVGASKILNAAGIPGIRYLDAGSRSSGEGTRNVVMFRDDLISIEGVD